MKLYAALFCMFLVTLSTAYADGQTTIKGDTSQNTVVAIAVGSKDHTTLVTALKAGDRVDVLGNQGPFTVFAPTNAAFAKLPPGTVENLLKPASLVSLQDVLEYHVFVGVLQVKDLRDGQKLNMVNGKDVVVHLKGGQVTIGTAKVLGTVRGSNGIVHVIDGVLLPPADQ